MVPLEVPVEQPSEFFPRRLDVAFLAILLVVAVLISSAIVLDGRSFVVSAQEVHSELGVHQEGIHGYGEFIPVTKAEPQAEYTKVTRTTTESSRSLTIPGVPPYLMTHGLPALLLILALWPFLAAVQERRIGLAVCYVGLQVFAVAMAYDATWQHYPFHLHEVSQWQLAPLYVWAMFLMLALGPHRMYSSSWLFFRGRAVAGVGGLALLIVVGTFWASSGSNLSEFTRDRTTNRAAFEYINPATNEPASFRLADIDLATVPASAEAESELWRHVRVLPEMLDDSVAARNFQASYLLLFGLILMLGTCLMLWPYRMLVRKGRMELATTLAATVTVAGTVWWTLGKDPLMHVSANGFAMDAGFLVVALLIAWRAKPASL
jgi:uncharacterized membrane protein